MQKYDPAKNLFKWTAVLRMKVDRLAELLRKNTDKHIIIYM